MATLVETGQLKLLIDPGASLAPMRHGFPPHPLEKWSLKKHLERIRLFIEVADVIIITHYHLDHFIQDNPEVYRDKILLLKNPNQHANVHQRNRAFSLLKQIQGLPKDTVFADGRTLTFGKTRLSFSDPVPHGVSEKMGYVLQVAVHQSDESFLFTSDVQGLCRDEPLAFIFQQNANTIYLDGPVTYLKTDTRSEEPLDAVFARIEAVIHKTNVVQLIIDHHLLRDVYWKSRVDRIFRFAKDHGVTVVTAAEFRGDTNQLLEARRKELFEDDLARSAR